MLGGNHHGVLSDPDKMSSAKHLLGNYKNLIESSWIQLIKTLLTNFITPLAMMFRSNKLADCFIFV